jgi:hypothetical protein
MSRAGTVLHCFAILLVLACLLGVWTETSFAEPLNIVYDVKQTSKNNEIYISGPPYHSRYDDVTDKQAKETK